jgi:pimeloyl-ACP methyl ester carboxylesterase
MDTPVRSAVQDRFVTIDGLKIRYIEEGSGHPAILLHGASLGSSADVFRRNLGPLASGGIRAIAFDQPGFGLSDNPTDWSMGYRSNSIITFMDALGLKQADLIGHSQSGNFAIEQALAHPDRIRRVVIMGTGSLLPPLPDGDAKAKTAGEPAEGQEGGESEPTLADTRTILEKNLFNHALISDDELNLRHSVSTGKNLKAFLARKKAPREKRAGGPLWQRLDEVKQPLLLIYGSDDRGTPKERVPLARQRYPKLEIHMIPNCKHLVQWDAADAFHKLAVPFLTK